MSAPKEATKKLFFNADKSKFVEEGSSEAASLAAAVGDPIPELAQPEKAAKPEPVEEPDAGVKIVKEQAPNKKADAAANKAK